MLRFLRQIPPYLLTLIVLVAICYLSLDADPFPDRERWFTFPGSDKVVHFIMYGGLTATFCFDYYRRTTARCKLWLLIVALAGIYIYKAKKSGKKCIGCSSCGSSCTGNCSSCSGCSEKKQVNK